MTASRLLIWNLSVESIDDHREVGILPPGRLRHWALTLGKFGAVQMLVQALGALSGLLVVRHLCKGDYALFTIANSMQGTMNLLADSGVSVALMAVGGKVWQDRRHLGELIRTALLMRRKLAAFVVVAVVPLLVWLLVHNGASPVYTGVLTAAVVVGLGFQLGLDVYIVVPRLHSQIARLQRLDLGAAALRLGLLGVFFLLFLDAGVAVWVATASIAWQLFRTKRWASACRSNRWSARLPFGIARRDPRYQPCPRHHPTQVDAGNLDGSKGVA